MSSSPDRSEALKNRLEQMRQQMASLEQEVAHLSTPAAGGQAAASALERLRDGLRQLFKATSAPTAFNLLLSEAVRHGERAVLFVPRKGELWAWAGLGPGGERLQIPRLTVKPEASPLLAGALQTQTTRRASTAEDWVAQIGEGGEDGGAAIPIIAGDRPTAVLWFDAGAPASPGALEAAECLAAAAGAALELIAIRRTSPALAAGGRVTADEKALGGSLPYAVGAAEGLAPGAENAPSPAASGGLANPDLARQHEDARRLARLLISEIKLYNEDKVVLGRKARDIYQRLREDIERSRRVYAERVSPEVRSSTDYFLQELVACLAEGDESLLGPVEAAST